MKRMFLFAAIAIASTSPVLAAGKCSTAPADKWQPKAKLEEQLKTEGLKVRRIKVENGCFEVYATDKAGKRHNIAYNAETLEKLNNAEAGEK